MANTIVPEIASGNAPFNIPQPEQQEISTDIIGGDGVRNYLAQNGILNTKAAKLKGDIAYFYNLNRLNTIGLSADQDSYSLANRQEYGYREVKMDKSKIPVKVSKEQTLDAIRAMTSIGKLDARIKDLLIDKTQCILRGAIFNHAAANTATSFVMPDIQDDAISLASEVAIATGHNTVESMQSDYVDYGNLNAGAPANPSAVTSANRVTLADFMAKENKLLQVYRNRSKFLTCDYGKCGFSLLHVIPHSFWLDMMTYAPTATSYPNIAYEAYQRLTATGATKDKEAGVVAGAFKLYDSVFTPYSRYLVLPDHMLPRAVHSNAEVANTRVAITFGKSAIDMKIGNATGGDNKDPMFGVRVDTITDQLNDENVWQIDSIFGVKRARVEGFGSGAGTKYEVATSTLIGYTAN